MSPELIVILVILAVVLLVIVGSYICYSITFKRKLDGPDDPYSKLERPEYQPFITKIHHMIDKLIEKPCEEIRIKSHDGLELFARYYHVKDGAPIMIKVHGYNGCPMRDFCGGGVATIDKDYNVLLIDQRGHEHSEGKCTSFGIMERHDVVTWAKYLVLRFGEDTKIVIYGISMGAATVLMASSMEEMPKNVKGVVADCGYSSPKDIIIKVATEDMHLPGKLLFPLIWLGARLFGGFNLTETSPVEAVKASTLPLLIIHGTKDNFVPHYMSEEIFAAAKAEDKKLLLFDGAAHGISYLFNEERYIGEVRSFMERIFK